MKNCVIFTRFHRGKYLKLYDDNYDLFPPLATLVHSANYGEGGRKNHFIK